MARPQGREGRGCTQSIKLGAHRGCLSEMLFEHPPDIRRGEYLGLGVFLLHFFPLVKM